MNQVLSWDVRTANDADMEFIDQELNAFNHHQLPFTQRIDDVTTPTILKNYVIIKEGAVIAGIKSHVYGWGILSIDRLYVDAMYRQQNLGSYLLSKVLEEARQEVNAYLVHTDTFSFQAKDFYLKHGFQIFGVLENCPTGHQRFYLKKDL